MLLSAPPDTVEARIEKMLADADARSTAFLTALEQAQRRRVHAMAKARNTVAQAKNGR